MASDPFNGLRLSEQTGAGKIEQRLFAPSPPPIRTKSDSADTRRQTAAHPATLEAPRNESGLPAPAPSPAPRFDIKELPLYKASFLFTQEELEAMEDLKLEMRRQRDVRVTKNQLIRLALHMLLEDHGAHGADSYASRGVKG